MYIDQISYELKDGISEDKLMEVSSLVYADWMSRLDGFISWQICKNSKDKYTDLVYWKDEKSARASEKLMSNMAHAEEWMNIYKPGSISSSPLHTLKIFEP